MMAKMIIHSMVQDLLTMACRHWLTSHLGYCFSRNEKLRENCVQIPDGGDDYDDDGGGDDAGDADDDDGGNDDG